MVLPPAKKEGKPFTNCTDKMVQTGRSGFKHVIGEMSRDGNLLNPEVGQQLARLWWLAVGPSGGCKRIESSFMLLQ